MAHSATSRKRPLSPHLQIYSPMLTMMMSITHRILGGILYFGALLLVWWLVAAASGPDYFNFVQGLFGSILGRIVLFGLSFALIHHAMGGIRHLIWDTGRGFDLATIEWMTRASLIASVSLTILLWLVAWWVH
jgi:succinate dehydrogenase / fumarate reductase cytochrome b subunit